MDEVDIVLGDLRSDTAVAAMNNNQSIDSWTDDRVFRATVAMFIAMDEVWRGSMFSERFDPQSCVSLIDTVKEPFYLCVRPVRWVTGNGWGGRLYRENLEEEYYRARRDLNHLLDQNEGGRVREVDDPIEWACTIQ